MIFSESRDERPEVGSSTKSTAGSLMSSSAILSLFLCPPLIDLLRTFPTLKFVMEESPKSFKVLLTLLTIKSYYHILKN